MLWDFHKNKDNVIKAKEEAKKNSPANGMKIKLNIKKI